MIQKEVTGLILRATNVREADRIVTIYTAEEGIVSALAPQARSYKSRKMSSTQQFCYGKFILERRGEYYRILDADLLESFFGMRDSLEGLALSSYFCEVLEDVATAEPGRDLLRLALNSLYATAQKRAPRWKIKAAFEIRLAAIIGFLPDILSCSECGTRNGDFLFHIMDGFLQCTACRQKQIDERREEPDEGRAHIVCPLSSGAKDALIYCIYCPVEKLYAFRLAPEDAALFARAAETYLLHHLERSFTTLEFYKSVEREHP